MPSFIFWPRPPAAPPVAPQLPAPQPPVSADGAAPAASAPRRRESRSIAKHLNLTARGFGVKSRTQGAAVVGAIGVTQSNTYRGADQVSSAVPVPGSGEAALTLPAFHGAPGPLGRAINHHTRLRQTPPARPAGVAEADLAAARAQFTVLSNALDGAAPGAFEAVVTARFSAAEPRAALAGQLSLLERDGAAPAAVARLAHTLALTCAGDAAQAAAVLDYLHRTDLPAEICGAARGLAPASSQFTQQTRAAAWRSAQVLSATPEAREALRAAVGGGERYRFQEPVLTVFLKTAHRLRDRHLCASALPEALFEKNANLPPLPLAGLRAAAKRLEYQGPLSDPAADWPDGQPDLAALTPLQRYQYAMARNGIDEDGPGSAFAKFEKRIEKVCERSVESKPGGKSPAGAISLEALTFAGRGESAKFKAATTLLGQMHAIQAARNAALPPLTAASAQPDWDIHLQGQLREAVLDVWGHVRFLEALKGQAFSSDETAHITRQVTGRLERDGVPFQRDKIESELRQRLEHLRISVPLMETWFDELVGKEPAADAPATEATAAAREQHRLLRVLTGKNGISAPWWDAAHDKPQRLQAYGAVINESIRNMAIGAYVEGRHAKLNGINTRNYLSTALSLVAGTVGVNIALKLGAALSRQAEIKFGLSGNSGYLSFLSKKLTAAEVSGGVLAGHKFKEDFGSVMVGAGVDLGYGFEDAHAEGLSFRMARMGREPRGNYPGRAIRGAGDAQLLQELGAVGETVFVGPDARDKAGGLSTRARNVLAKFPDGVAVTVLAAEDDAKTSHTFSAAAKGGLSVGLMGRGGFGATAGVGATWKTSGERREERGAAISVSARANSAAAGAGASWGVGANAAERLDPMASQNLAAVDLYGGALRFWDDGKTEKTALIVTDDSIAKNSNRLTTYTSLQRFLEAVAPDNAAVAAEIARGALARSYVLPKDAPVAEASKTEALAAAGDAIAQYFQELRRDVRPTQTFQKFDELTDAACAKLNQIHTTHRIAEAGGDPALAHAAEEARAALMDDPSTWMLGFYMTLDTDDRVRQQGMDYVLRALSLEGASANYLVKWLSGS